MPRTFGKTLGTLVLTGLLVDVAWGQAPPMPSADAVGMVAVDAAKARDCEIQVELALLADPLTFPYAIKTQFASAGLVLRGYVPNPTVKERAVTLARGIVPLEVVD